MCVCGGGDRGGQRSQISGIGITGSGKISGDGVTGSGSCLMLGAGNTAPGLWESNMHS